MALDKKELKNLGQLEAVKLFPKLVSKALGRVNEEVVVVVDVEDVLVVEVVFEADKEEEEDAEEDSSFTAR